MDKQWMKDPLRYAMEARLSGKKRFALGAVLTLVFLLAAVKLCAAAMLARVSFIERSAGDYEYYLADWLQKLSAGSFADGMRQNIGEYNVLYQYILFIITRLPVPPLYAVKAVSFIGDAFLAGAAASLAEKDGKPSMAAFGAMLLLPTVVLNGGMFAQCDSLYAACALWGLALALREKPARAAVCFALSLAFKLQAVFMLPMVIVLWADKKLRLSDALVFVLTLALTALPALLGGKSLHALLSIYTAQTGLYTGLNYGAANFFALLNTNGLDVYAYGNFGMGLAFGVCALLTVSGVRRAGRMNRRMYLRYALLFPLMIVFCLPRMHERYFYLADAMKKTDRMRIIRMLYKRRAFTYQKSVAIVAERLNVSRYTVYKYMHELEEAEAAGSLVQD